MVLHTVQRRWRDLHQSVVGCLLFFAACVAVVQVVHPVCYLWKQIGELSQSSILIVLAKRMAVSTGIDRKG